MYFYDIISSPIGDLLLVASENGLKEIRFEAENQNFQIDQEWIFSPEKLQQVKRELNEYFTGERTSFSIPLSPEGTPFQKQIWKELQSIPYGKTCSYQDIANQIQKPNSCRAVGMANGKNPIPIIIPCHRIIGKNGKLVDYAGGLHKKLKLLQIEKANFLEKSSQLLLF